MELLNSANETNLFNVPTPLQGGVPWLVYPRQGVHGEQQTFYSIVDGLTEEVDNYYFDQTTCLASMSGWLLFQITENSRHLILFNPFSRKLIPLPKFIGEEPDHFVFSSTPGNPDCAIVAGYRRYHRYVLYCRPNDERWEKCALDIHGNCLIQTVAGCDGKAYLYTSEHLLMIVDFTSLPSVEYVYTNVPAHPINLGSLEHAIDLVAFSGELFIVKRIFYSSTCPKLFLTLVVLKLDQSSLTWVGVETLNGSIFVLADKFASAFIPSNSNLKGDSIYFLDGNFLYGFDMEYKSLTVRYPCSWDFYKHFRPFWLLQDNSLNESHQKQTRNEKEARVPCSYEKHLFDHPKPLPSHTKRISNIINSCNVWPRWRLATPWLMFTHKNDGTFKLLDPCSKVIYEIYVPGLSNSVILASKGGWLFAENSTSPFFINPFSKEKLELPQVGKIKLRKMVIGASFSSPPITSECIAFYIVDGFDRSVVRIFIHRSGEDQWTRHVCLNEFPFLLSHSSPVCLNGRFYCLGIDGKVGVYDPTDNTWRVFNSSVSIVGQLCTSTLVESGGKLLSVFTDFYRKPIGVFEFNFDSSSWESISDLGGRTLFFGRGASVCMSLNDEQMKNMFCFPTFQREWSFDLITYPVESVSVPSPCTKPKTEFLSTWIDPGNTVLRGFDRINGIVY